jgi:hypothetical protein
MDSKDSNCQVWVTLPGGAEMRMQAGLALAWHDTGVPLLPCKVLQCVSLLWRARSVRLRHDCAVQSVQSCSLSHQIGMHAELHAV